MSGKESSETIKPTVWVATVGMPFPSFLVASSLYAVSNFLECLDEVLVGAFLGVIYYCHCLVGNGCFNLPDTLDKTYVALDLLLAVWTVHVWGSGYLQGVCRFRFLRESRTRGDGQCHGDDGLFHCLLLLSVTLYGHS